MKMLIALYYFQRRIAFPIFFFSGFLSALNMGALGGFSWGLFGWAILLLAPFIHFFIYEILKPQEYYFYHNLGFNKLILWLSTLFFYLVLGLFFIVI